VYKGEPSLHLDLTMIIQDDSPLMTGFGCGANKLILQVEMHRTRQPYLLMSMEDSTVQS